MKGHREVDETRYAPSLRRRSRKFTRDPDTVFVSSGLEIIGAPLCMGSRSASFRPSAGVPRVGLIVTAPPVRRRVCASRTPRVCFRCRAKGLSR
jgi:hypothetical protein